LEEENTTNGRGRRKLILIILAMCVLVVIVGLAIWLGGKEPEYQGRKLSKWMDLARSDDPRNLQADALQAIRSIGTNGLPWFAKWMNYETPAWKRAFLRSKYANTAPKRVMRVLVKPLDFAAQSRQELIALGPVSVPWLAPMMDRYPSTTSRLAIDSLGRLGESALPSLVAVATNRAKPIQFRRLVLDTISTENKGIPVPPVRSPVNPIWQQTLGYIPWQQSYSSSLIAILMPCLHERGLEVSTVRVLGRLGLTADTAFQVFTNGITAKNVEVRIAAVRWAALFKSNTARATPELIKCFNDSELAVRRETTNALQKIAPEVLTDQTAQTASQTAPSD
jgi:hypothetical protein